jgi:hypothetical protein
MINDTFRTFWQRKDTEVEIEGVVFIVTYSEPIQVGDTYIAERNTGPKLLTALELGEGCIHPKEFPAYSFDTYECAKVIGMK